MDDQRQEQKDNDEKPPISITNLIVGSADQELSLRRLLDALIR
jgi:hypothetical protein